MPVDAEQEERRYFMKNPVVIVTDAEKVAGGIWIDNVTYKRNDRGEYVHPKARFQILFTNDRRRFAYPALEYFIGRAKGKY